MKRKCYINKKTKEKMLHKYKLVNAVLNSCNKKYENYKFIQLTNTITRVILLQHNYNELITNTTFLTRLNIAKTSIQN